MRGNYVYFGKPKNGFPLDQAIAKIKALVDTDDIADKLVEKQYQLRIEHDHGTMKWYAYYAGKSQRNLFDEDADWQTASDTPTEALRCLGEIRSIWN